MVFGCLFVLSVAAQTQPANAAKHTKQTAVGKINNVSAKSGATVANDRAAGTGESLVVPGKDQKKPGRENKRIPDGSYGTNRSGQVYSPSNPNFPYRPDGTINPTIAKDVFYSSTDANSAVTNRAGTEKPGSKPAATGNSSR